MDLAGVAIQGLQRSAMDTLGDVQALASDGRQQLSTRGQDIGRVLATAEKALQAARDLLASANSLVARGARPRDDLEATLRDLAASASALRDLSQALDRDPNIVLLGRKGDDEYAAVRSSSSARRACGRACSAAGLRSAVAAGLCAWRRGGGSGRRRRRR